MRPIGDCGHTLLYVEVRLSDYTDRRSFKHEWKILLRDVRDPERRSKKNHSVYFIHQSTPNVK